MSETERLARTVAQQRTGNENRWREFIEAVQMAEASASGDPMITARDFLDEPETV